MTYLYMYSNYKWRIWTVSIRKGVWRSWADNYTQGLRFETFEKYASASGNSCDTARFESLPVQNGNIAKWLRHYGYLGDSGNARLKHEYRRFESYYFHEVTSFKLVSDDLNPSKQVVKSFGEKKIIKHRFRGWELIKWRTLEDSPSADAL